MDAALKNATAQQDTLTARIAQLEQELKVAKADLDRARQFIISWKHFAGQIEDSPASEFGGKNPPKEWVAKIAVQILEDANRPMNRLELFEELKNRGIVLHGKDPVVVLSTMLWRMKEVVSFVRGLGYWPMGTPLPGRHILNGRVVTDHVVTEADTVNAETVELSQVLYAGAPGSLPSTGEGDEEEEARAKITLFE